MSIYEKNLLAIQERDDALYHAIEKQDDVIEDISFCVDTAKNQELIICARQDDKMHYMNSRYNPEREAQRFAAQYEEVVDYSFMIFFGLGNGKIAEEVIKTRGEHVVYLFYEPSPNLFRLVLEHFDLTPLFENSRVLIVVRGMNDGLLESDIAMRIGVDNYKLSIFDVLPTYKNLFPEEEKKLEDKYRFLVSLVKVNISTNAHFGEAETYNNIYNMRYLMDCNCEEDFEDLFPVDRPAIVVAAGPSLEKNVQYLKEAKGKFLIIAVDSALRYLAEQGIEPDIAFVADPKKPVRLFENEKVQRIPLALYSAANREIVELVKEKIVFVSSHCPYYNKMFQIAGKHMYLLTGGGSVATVAFMLAIAWGYRKIVLVGQDLALAPDKVHAGNDDIDLFKLEAPKMEIEGYYGDKIYTSPDYNFYKEWYEMVIQADRDLEVINATEGGARIAGTIPKPLKEVIDAYDVEPFDFEKTIREMPPTFSEKQRTDVVQMWRDSVENLKALKEKLNEGMQLIRSGIELIQEKRYTRDQVAEMQQRVNQIITECNEFEEIYFVDSMSAEEEGDVLGDIYIAEKDDADEVCRIFEKLLKYMNTMCSSVDVVKELFEKIIKEVTGSL